MVDFVTMLVGAGITLAEKVVFSWFENGRAKVRVSQLEQTIADLAAKEAERSKIQEAELRRITERIIKDLIADSPKLSYVKPRFHETVVSLDFDPKDPVSSNALLSDLQARIAPIARKEIAPPAPDASFEIVPPPPAEPPAKPQPARASELLRELRERITDRESPRE